MSKNRQIAVIGAGLMGHGIALTLARAAQYVAITDPSPEARASVARRIGDSLKLLGTSDEQVAKTLKRIEIFDSVTGAVSKAAFVFEAAPERLELKRALFAEIEAAAPRDAILASNTSVLPITAIMNRLDHKERAVGTHWWNPAHMIPLVEVIRTEWTTEAVVEATMQLLADAGKTPVRVEKDVPGFIGNRLQHALWREAVSLVERGICDAEAVDTVIKASFGRRLAVLGPLENADLVGTDLTLAIHETVLSDLEASPEPSPYLRQLVEEGNLGMKTGRGFHVWSPGEADAASRRVSTYLQRLEGILGK